MTHARLPAQPVCLRLVVATVVALLISSTAHAAMDSCSLSGPYLASASIDATPASEFLGTLTFTPPARCADAGTVNLSGAVVAGGTSEPIASTGLPYTVDGSGALRIQLDSANALSGLIGLVVDNVARSFVFVMGPGPTRISGWPSRRRVRSVPRVRQVREGREGR